MNILAFRHFDFDDDHAFAAWAAGEGHVWTVRDPSQGVDGDWLPDTDLLIILGGPMSVYQESDHPWLIEEKAFVRQAMARGTKVLGICLGAQMVAELLGGEVYRNGQKEIGWHEVKRTAENHPWLADLPESFYSFQWHGDTFRLPEGAKLLACSEACAIQAFSYGDHVMGVQFHLETSPACIDTMLEKWRGELTDGPYIQSAEQIRGGYGRSGASWEMLRGILSRIGSSPAGLQGGCAADRTIEISL
ncbi:type 1 glutamine amidotransferase [Paenibacillus arenilitoris]|uniref:Type 1 glutamine amidotransferase n=1 Tax=Paenibacillus arenilitoris TaxID=2772299 RepID=A0A927CGK4_9BACL|nr:type 1 glutamine amidotransferase [Paenibacillus arenilitoris]MBD2867165.1 type 1 glutamine amidotransferase [Paenibacillus arenilitoris]